MATSEQLEAWASEAANALELKIGEAAQVILMVMDAKHLGSPYFIERRGTKAVLVYLLEIGAKTIKEQLLPKSTIQRQGDGK